MKKISSLAVLLFMVIITNAQIISVPYRGAFAPAPTPMWTNTWTNWDPQTTVYPVVGAGNPKSKVIGGASGATISVNTTLYADTTYEIAGLVYVRGGATLTIQPGTVILGSNRFANSTLIITQGAKIMAEGTPAKPIVFTSQYNPGFRAPGNWGGVIILGNAHYNGTSAAGTPTPSTYGVNYIEGITPVNSATQSTQYGGGTTPNDADNSGVLKYVRIEYGGYVFSQNVEINGLTLGAVGSGTTIDYVQCSFINDDAFEWFGGAVNCSHLVSYRGVDDEFDTDNGFSGTVQFCLGVRDPQIADNSYSLASGGSNSEGFESDNDSAGSTNSPKTRAIFSNITLVGPLRGVRTSTNLAAIHPSFRRMARIRRNSELRILNSVLMDYPRGIHIDGTACEALAAAGTSSASLVGLKFKNNIVAGYGATTTATGGYTERNSGSTFDINTWFAANANDSIGSTANILTTPYNYLLPDYRPKAGGLAVTGSDYSDTVLAGIVTPCVAPSTPGPITGTYNVSQCDTNALYTYSVPFVAGLTYVWSLTGNRATIVSGQGTNSIQARFGSNYIGGNVVVLAFNACGSATATYAVIKKIPATPGTITAKSTNFCLFTNVLLPGDTMRIKKVPFATNYLWEAPGSSIVTHLNPAGPNDTIVVIHFVTDFTLPAYVKVYNVSGCDTSLAKSLTLASKGPATPGTITPGTVNVCPRLGVDTVSYRIKKALNATGYNWVVPAGSTVVHPNGAGVNDTIIFVTLPIGLTKDTVKVQATGGCIPSAFKILAVSALLVPTTPVITTSAASFNNCFGDVTTFTATSTPKAISGTAASYGWVKPAGVTITSATADSASITCTFAAPYTGGSLKAFAKSACGINGLAKTQALTHTGCGVGLRSAKSITKVGTQVFPNPNDGNFTLNVETGINAKMNANITITNVFGQVVAKYAASNNNGFVNLRVANNKLVNGVYTVTYTVGAVTNSIRMTVQK